MTRPCLKSTRVRRRGAALVEAALVLPVTLTSIFVILDLGLAATRSNSLSACARHAARMAIVHGERSQEPLGPQTWTGTLADDYPLAKVIRNCLLSMPPDDVSMTVTWPDDRIRDGDRVQVQLTFNHASILLDLFGEFELTATSTMRIVH